MFTHPSSDELLEGCIISLQNDILPALTNERAQVVAVMMQALLQEVRQRIPIELQIMAAEQNEMTALFRHLETTVAGEAPEAVRLRERAREQGARADVAVPPPWAEVTGAYRDLSAALVDTVDDLDTLIGKGDESAEQALTATRQYLAKRTAADFGTLVVAAGMAGRG